MHSKSDIKLHLITMQNEVAEELIESLCSRYQGNLETSIR